VLVLSSSIIDQASSAKNSYWALAIQINQDSL